MSATLRNAAMGSSLALIAFAAAGIAAAQDTTISRETFMECVDQGSCDELRNYRKPPSQNNRDYRVSCREGGRIVDDSGYRSVRAIECGGGTFTYTGRRNGDTFKLLLNSRTGRIVRRQEL